MAAECGISRQAFYYHFQDILAISEWVLQEKLKELLSDAKAEMSPREKLYRFVKTVADNAVVILEDGMGRNAVRHWNGRFRI